MSQSTLVSLAMLKLHADGGRDYLDYLRPFIFQVLSENPPYPVTDSSIAEKIKKIHGLIIPARTVQVVLRRIAKEKLISRDNGIYTVNRSIDIPKWFVNKEDISRKITLIAKSLVCFAKENTSKEITEEEAIDSFVLFLSKFSIPCLKHFLNGTTLPHIKEGYDWKVVLVSEFINHIESTSTDKFDAFMLLAQGNMLANALLCPDLKNLTQNYENVTFYFDTPILLRLLGLEGERKKSSIDELVNIIKHLGGKIAVFTHTYDELKGTIERVSDYIDLYDGRGAIVFEARSSGRTRSDLLLIAEKSDVMLLSAGIEIQDTPKYIKDFQIDETAFDDMLLDEINYINTRAKEYDINSVRSIYVLRKGLSPLSLEKCKAVFVTTNNAFADAASKYGNSFEQSREISTVITDFSLVNISWLKAPLGAPLLPKKEILAFAYAAMQPTRDFWNRTLQEAEKLEEIGTITASDHQLLRSSPKALSELVKMTLGDDRELSECSIQETLDRVTKEIKTKEEKRSQELEYDNYKLREKVRLEEEKFQNIKQNVYWTVYRSVAREARIFSWIIACILIVFCLLSLLSGLDILTRNQAILIAILPVIFSIIGFWKDIKIFQIQDWYQQRRFTRKLKSEYARLNIDDEDSDVSI